MCAQETKRNRIIDSTDARTPQKEIAKILGVSDRIVRRIRHARKFGGSTKRLPGSGGHHRKENKVFLDTLKENEGLWRILQSA